MSKLITYLFAPPWVMVCSLGLAFGANAHTATPPSTTPLTSTTSAPAFLGDSSPYPFSEAVQVGNTLYLSGQIGFKDGKLVKGGIKSETKQTLDNIQNTLSKYGYQKFDLIKCTAMLADMDDFDDFNKVYKMELSRPYPVRSAFGVSELAAGASVEIECVAAK